MFESICRIFHQFHRIRKLNEESPLESHLYICTLYRRYSLADPLPLVMFPVSLNKINEFYVIFNFDEYGNTMGCYTRGIFAVVGLLRALFIGQRNLGTSIWLGYSSLSFFLKQQFQLFIHYVTTMASYFLKTAYFCKKKLATFPRPTSPSSVRVHFD